MGVNLSDLVEKKEFSLDYLNGKKVGIDSYNILYQFLASIRGQDGMPLMDSNGEVTSHLTGLFYRTINLLQNEIKPIFVFDGVPSKLKRETLRKRKELRTDAAEKAERAVKEGALEEARKQGSRALKLSSDMVQEAKSLAEALGLPVITAPEEGEAQIAQMNADGKIFGAVSQDFDVLLFGGKRLLRYVASSGKRKVPGKNFYADISPEEIDAVARLMSDLGVLFETNYSSTGSGAFPDEDDLPTHFGYSDELEVNYDREDNFFPIVKNQLEKKYPVFFGSNSHAYVADGYRIDLGMNQTHFNFGWDGYSDGWYTSEELGDLWKDSVNVTMIINIHPEGSDFPKPLLYVESTGFCGGNTPCYSTIQAAIDAASFGAIIAIAEERYSENLNLNLAKEITLSGGWNFGFSTQSSNTVINSLTITSGTVEIENMVLQ